MKSEKIKLMGFFVFNVLSYIEPRKKNKIKYCTKTNTSGWEEYSKVMGELSIRNSANCFRKFARRKSY